MQSLELSPYSCARPYQKHPCQISASYQFIVWHPTYLRGIHYAHVYQLMFLEKYPFSIPRLEQVPEGLVPSCLAATVQVRRVPTVLAKQGWLSLDSALMEVINEFFVFLNTVEHLCFVL